MSNRPEPVCPCDRFIHPRVISNPAGLSSIAYRVGDFITFRHALLHARHAPANALHPNWTANTGEAVGNIVVDSNGNLQRVSAITGDARTAGSAPAWSTALGTTTIDNHVTWTLVALTGETELVNWRPSASQDLALQLVEWWAYLADILTFYNQRIANQDYLRTADLPESVNRLIRVLGYRPRPGIGATGTLAALLNRQTPLTLQRGFQVQSKPGPGQQPQIFELNGDTTLTPPDTIVAQPQSNPSLFATDAASGLTGVLLAGTITSLKQGDELLILKTGWNGSDANWALVFVAQVRPEPDPQGKPNTRVLFNSAPALTGAQAADYRLLSTKRFARAWQYPVGTGFAAIDVAGSTVHLDSIVRDIKPADPILFDISGGALTPQLVSVTKYSELAWFANPDSPALNPTVPPASPTPPIPITHSVVMFTRALTGSWEANKQATVVRFGWQDVGQIIGAPAASFDGTTPTLLVPPSVEPLTSQPILIEDANGIGESAVAGGAPPAIGLTNLPVPLLTLAPPLSLLLGLLQVSRGKTVRSEILGSGDATQVGQEFVLTNSPLTYLLGASSVSGQNYASTLRVEVDGVAWQEVANFYGQPARAQVFVTREDENQKTHVMFGDGINGARLPTGVNNVVATYRYGSGAKAPSAGTLTLILKPQPNLRAIHNPVAVGGGSDPAPPDQIRRYAPQSVLTLGRAISGDDYEAIAAAVVPRARSYWTWDGDQQRTLVTIYVGDDQSAVDAARTALALADDPNRLVVVKLATVIPIELYLTLLIDPQYDTARVTAGVTAALLDPQSGLFGESLRIGQTIYDSEIYAACLSVPGALAVHDIRLYVSGSSVADATELHAPGEGGFFQLSSDHLHISTGAAGHA
jgi:hypothetical protein